MASKRKKYIVQRRFEVWVEVEVTAGDFDDAVAKSKELKLEDYLVTAPDASINDWSDAGGRGVIEI
jgi:hypothetical protein